MKERKEIKERPTETKAGKKGKGKKGNQTLENKFFFVDLCVLLGKQQPQNNHNNNNNNNQ